MIERCSNQTATTCCATKSEVPELIRPRTIKAFVVSMSLSIVGFPLIDSFDGLCSVSNADTVLVGVWVVSGPLACKNSKAPPD